MVEGEERCGKAQRQQTNRGCSVYRAHTLSFFLSHAHTHARARTHTCTHTCTHSPPFRPVPRPRPLCFDVSLLIYCVAYMA